MFFHWFDIITFIMFILFVIGFVYNDPHYFIQLNFIIKVVISIYLMYKFNDFRSTPIKFSVLDQKICYSAGFYIFVVSFADVINSYFVLLRNFLLNIYGKIKLK